jgi:hypothetical protein
MTLDEIRTAKIQMEAQVKQSITAALDEFEGRTGMRASGLQIDFIKHSPVGQPNRLWVTTVKAEVDPWQ